MQFLVEFLLTRSQLTGNMRTRPPELQILISIKQNECELCHIALSGFSQNNDELWGVF